MKRRNFCRRCADRAQNSQIQYAYRDISEAGGLIADSIGLDEMAHIDSDIAAEIERIEKAIARIKRRLDKRTQRGPVE